MAQGAPVIVDTRFFAGQVGWAIEFPILVTFSAGTRRASQALVARVLVMRVPLDERPAGIAIEQLIAGKGPSGQGTSGQGLSSQGLSSQRPLGRRPSGRGAA